MSANDCQDCQTPSQPVLEESPSQGQTIGRAPAEVQMTSDTVEVKSASGIKPDQSTSDSASGQNAEGGPSTSTPDILPPHTVYPNLIIEFCDRCRWATWIQTELFLTFPTPAIKSIALIPLNTPETGGRFRIWLDRGEGEGSELMWDRKTEGGFPELKVLKQRLRNRIQPEMSLGHSDKPGTKVIGTQQ